MINSSLLNVCLSLFMFLFQFNGLGAFTEYTLTNDLIDVIIPTTNKDLVTLEKCIEGIQANCVNLGRIIVVSDQKYTDKAEWFDEKEYPFQIEDVAFYLCNEDVDKTEKYLGKKDCRVGWYLQQLLKLYAPYVIPNLSQNVLVLDSDTIFLNPINFVNDRGGGYLNVSSEYHQEYFVHADKLTRGLVKKIYPQYSGITHHMLFQKPVLDDLFHRVEEIHQMEFWKAFCKCVDRINGSGASEYEIYFNFVLSQTKQAEIRKLKWKNIRNLGSVNKYRRMGYDYVSCHSYLRKL